MSKDMETAFYNIMKYVIEPRYMSIFRFKKGCKKIQFPCHNITALYWCTKVNIHDDKITTAIKCNGKLRTSHKSNNYYCFTHPYMMDGWVKDLTLIRFYNYVIQDNASDTLRHVIDEENKSIKHTLILSGDSKNLYNIFIPIIRNVIEPYVDNETFEERAYKAVSEFCEYMKQIMGINSFFFHPHDDLIEKHNYSFIGGLDINNYEDDIVIIVEHNKYYHKTNKLFI